MARDKLITIRIEGEKRDAFNQLAKSQNTDTASLLYDFINQCLDGRIDISLVTGQKQRIDNRLDSERLDKLEMTTQGIAERVGQISKKLTDWVEAFDDRLSALSIQKDSQQDRQKDSHKLDRIDTDSQQDRQKDSQQDSQLDSHKDSQLDSQKREASIASPSPSPNQESVEPADNVEPVTDAIEDFPIGRQGLTNDQLHKKIGIPTSTIEKWKGKILKGEKVQSTKYPAFFRQWRLNHTDSLWYEID